MLVHGPYPLGEARVAREARAALAAGWEVDVLATRRPGEPARERVDGADVHRLPFAHRRGLALPLAAAEYAGFALLATAHLARLARHHRFAVVQVHAPPDFLAAAALVPKLLGSSLLLDVHDLSPHMFAMRFGHGRLATSFEHTLEGVERRAADLADAVVTVHEPYRRELIALGVPPEKVHVVMNSVDERLLPRQAAPPHDRFTAVYHGTITPPYGVELLVQAAAAVQDLSLEIYGDGDSEPAVARLVRELGLDPRVTLVGRQLPQREVLERISGASVGVIPNLPTRLNRFALSSKLFEYVALGIPAVVADLPTLRAHFDPEEVRFFRAGDASALAQALRETAAEPDSARRRAEAARRRYEAYRWPVQRERYLALLDLLAASR